MAAQKIEIALAILLLNIVCFISVLIACAYLISEDKTDNVFSVGNNRSAIVEDYDEVRELKPGDIIKKEVKISNTGKNSCYIRVLSLFSDSDVKRYANINYNENDWELKEDGYYYYRFPIASGEETSELFSSVNISAEVEQEEIKGFKILIYAESVNVETGGFS